MAKKLKKSAFGSFTEINVEANAGIVIAKCRLDYCKEPGSRFFFCAKHNQEWLSSTEQRRYCDHLSRRPSAAASVLADFVRRLEFEQRNGAK